MWNWPLTLKCHPYLKLALRLPIYRWSSEGGDYKTGGSQESHNIDVTYVTSQYLHKVQKGKIHNQTGTTTLTPNLTRRPLKSQWQKKKFLGIWGHLSWVCTMEVGTVLVGIGLFGTWVASQNQIPLWIYYSKSGHAENPEGRLTDLWKVVVMLAGGVCGGGEVPGGSVRRFLGYCLRHLLHKAPLPSSPTVLCFTWKPELGKF